MPSMKRPLQILEFIKRYQLSNHTAPPIALICRQFGMRSTASVHAHLKTLQDKGLIKRERYSRYIQIVEQEQKNAA